MHRSVSSCTLGTTQDRGDPVNLYVAMTVKTWLENAIQDADRRGFAALRPMLEALARATSALRSADWNGDATGESDTTPPHDD